MSKIDQALSRMFEHHRIVFWYDPQRELREDYEAIELDGVAKREVKQDQFLVKHVVLREQPNQKFLLYFNGPQPDDLDNWLLDVQLSHGVFQANKLAILMTELDLPLDFAETLQAHATFFDSKVRVEAFKNLIGNAEYPRSLRMKMLAVCAGAAPSLDAILEALLSELSVRKDDRMRLISRCALDRVLWEQANDSYGYQSSEHSVHDFALALFQSCYRLGTGRAGPLANEALVFLKRWKDSIQHREAFEVLSDQCAKDLGIEQDLSTRSYQEVVEIDYFRVIDHKILRSLVSDVASRAIDLRKCLETSGRRRVSHWHREFQDLYTAVECAARLLYGLEKADLGIHSLEDGAAKYTKSWFRFDQLYRRFVVHCRKAKHPSLVQELAEQVENHYVNNFVLKVNDNWQRVIDASTPWEVKNLPHQRQFYKKWVKPFVDQDKKVFVVISDALRFEIADSLLSRIRQEDRYEATLVPMLSSLPSTTQVGMAALLPHDKLMLVAKDGSETVFVDGISSQGTANRAKILNQSLPGRATAVQAEDFLQMGREESRSLTREHQVVYIYHNQIDDTGDKRISEKRVFEAVDETLNTLVSIIKKLAAANANNFIVTSDHGFLYQNREIDEGDFADAVEDSGNQTYQGRRYILGTALPEQPGLKTFHAADVGLAGDVVIQLPKSVNRLRLKGAGSRFVHGGASLQEVVLPVLLINKKRKSDLSKVTVDILAGESSVITSGQLGVRFYQTVPVSDKTQPSVLRAGIYTQAGELISDTHDLMFDSASDSARDREKAVRFILAREAEKVNNQMVVLRLEENVEGTTHYRTIKTVSYQLRRSLSSDFDF